MSEPLVSVCIPTRDRARYLRGAVTSALAQDVDLEVLVGDDASTDGTALVLRELRDARVRRLRQMRPLGVAANRNTLLARARGRYVAWLDDDDELLPGALARQVRVLEEHASVDVVHGAFEVIGADGEPLPPWPAPFARDTFEPAARAFRELLGANELTTSTVVVRRSALDAAGPFSAWIGPSSTDWEMWLRLALRGDVAYTAASVARYRQHPASISRRTTSGGERLRCDVRAVMSAAAHRPELAGNGRTGLAARALLHAGDAYTAGRRARAASAIALAARLAPRAVGRDAGALLSATARGDDDVCYRVSKRLLRRLGDCLGDTRYGARVRDAGAEDPVWEARLRAIAAVVARETPPEAVLACIDKWDPTLRRLAGRRGMTFPDRRLLPDGYPRTSEIAVAHLEALRGRGVSHLVVPCASFWWLEHYEGLAERLAGCEAWRDDDCAIFALR
jgi:glycosyltransferase involved in cell wall biosynthesis